MERRKKDLGNSGRYNLIGIKKNGHQGEIIGKENAGEW